jgi:hypothetical protein
VVSGQWSVGSLRYTLISDGPMNHTAKVVLHWFEAPSDRPFPRAQRFSRPARFEHQGEDWKQNAWSLSVITEGDVDAQGRQSAAVKFFGP